MMKKRILGLFYCLEQLQILRSLIWLHSFWCDLITISIVIIIPRTKGVFPKFAISIILNFPPYIIYMHKRENELSSRSNTLGHSNNKSNGHHTNPHTISVYFVTLSEFGALLLTRKQILHLSPHIYTQSVPDTFKTLPLHRKRYQCHNSVKISSEYKTR